jgi:hypothetical protein
LYLPERLIHVDGGKCFEIVIFSLPRPTGVLYFSQFTAINAKCGDSGRLDGCPQQRPEGKNQPSFSLGFGTNIRPQAPF